MGNPIRIENSDLLCILNDSGIILELTNKKTNASLVAQGENLTGWKMVSSVGPWREHPIFDADNHADVTAEATRAVLRFGGLQGSKERQAFNVTMTYELHGEELVAQVEVDNASGETLREIWFPFLSGIRELDQRQAHKLIINASDGMIMDDPLHNLPRYDGVTFGHRPAGQFFSYGMGRYPLLYPGACAMPWMDYYNSKQGWYLGYHDMKTPSTALLMRARDVEEDMQLGFARYPFVKPGKKWSSGKFVIRCHEGGWHAGAKRYAEFTSTKFERPSAPGWIQDSPGFQIISCISQDRRINNPYSHIYDTFKANRAEGLELPIIVFGWVKRGFDNGYPELDPDERLGGAEKLREAIAKVRAEGGKVLLYTQGRLIDLCTDFYKTIGKDCCVVSEDGTPYKDEYSFNFEATLYPNRLFALSCPSTYQWEDQLKQQIDIVMDLGANGLLYDQIGADAAYICFNENHEHESPDMAFHGKIQLLDNLQKYAASKDPEFAIVGELTCDAFLHKLDFIHGWATQDSGVTDLPAGAHLSSNIYRYTYPHHRPSSRLCASRDDYSNAFINGLVLEHYRRRDNANAMDVYEYVVKLQKLRGSLMDFINNSIFVDDDGLSCQPAAVAARHYVGDDCRHGVAFANFGDRPTNARIVVEGMPAEATLYTIYGDKQAISAKDGAYTINIEAHTAAFILENG
ncbi:MAG: DUF6259 domain-containing protein [Oscillospiraceae bacterium]|nr:DUF6259 domain-containing protein [Oscillospiraceae bacterium]